MKASARKKRELTPLLEHSLLLWSVGHLVWSMNGNMEEQVWLTQSRLSPHGVPSRTRPRYPISECCGRPVVALENFGKKQL